MNNITPYEGKTPLIHQDAFVDMSVRIIGDVTIEEGANIWPMSVLRADSAPIRIGKHTAVLDHCTIEAPQGHRVVIEGGSLISHGVIIHGATIKSNVLIGIGAIILDNVTILEGSIIGAGSIITVGTIIPRDSLVLGTPGKVIRQTTEYERENIMSELAGLYRKSRIYTKYL